jgi:hypothetical protein
MNWLERARREIGETATGTAANTADGYSTAAMAVLHPAPAVEPATSIGSNGSAPPSWMRELDAVREAFEERAAIMEFDGGLNRDDAERAAWALVLKQRRLH